MKAIILAAGRGSRMRASTEDRPKCLVELAGRPLLDYQKAALAGAGIARLGIVTGYRADALAGRADATFHNARWAETNMVMSLTAAAPWLREGPCVISYSDIFFQPEAVTRLSAARADIAITYDPEWLRLWSRRFADPLSDAETFACGADNMLIDIGRRPSSLDEVRGQYMGLLRFTPAGWAAVEAALAALEPERRDRLDMTSLLRLLMERGNAIEAVPIASRWGEVDNEHDLAIYESSPEAFGL